MQSWAISLRCKVGSLSCTTAKLNLQSDDAGRLALSYLGPYAGSHQLWLYYGINQIGNVMPVRNANIKETTLAAHRQLSHESLLASWLLGDGWEVLIPAIDHGKKTDLVVADDNRYYRIQVKSLKTTKENFIVENKWQGANIDYVVYFSINCEWGYITPAFPEASRPLNMPGHIRFHKHPTNFLKAFKKI